MEKAIKMIAKSFQGDTRPLGIRMVGKLLIGFGIVLGEFKKLSIND